MALIAILSPLLAAVSAYRTPLRQYQPCGGHVINPKPCPRDFIFIDDPRKPGCGMACDITGICIKPRFCGGLADIPCPRGRSVTMTQGIHAIQTMEELIAEGFACE
ncbi:hypothetical protein ACJ73_07478 [Blastomyces percursus]|uniref:Uncharacterized protein n=1 Tax=Blastomyces percursus TaxID=1658174 RepID=A0A1J9PXX9_9EURO|nr:hypothetical protein ACJ73_07478 [Blastomyces percursus]